MKTIFRKTFGDSPQTRVLEFLIEGRELDHSMSDIAEGAEISRTTLFRIWPDIKNAEIVKPTRIIGNAKLYILNTQNIFVKKTIEAFDKLIMPKKKILA